MKTFIIAEMSANHNHKKETALRTIEAAKNAGADAVKIQTYTADTITLDCDNEYFQINQGTLWDGTTLYKLYQQAYTPWEWHKELFDYAAELDIPLFSTPFDKTAIDFLETLNNPIYKIASFEITDIPLIEYAASKHKPMIISTGIATLQEVEEAVAACEKVGNLDITLLKCTSAYPAPLNEANLLTIPDMLQRFNCKVGLSDHTMGDTCACAAVALGAKVIEKHFIIDRSIGGPDSAFSMNEKEFGTMVKRIRETEECLGRVSYELSELSKKSRKFSRSLFAVQDIRKGDVFTEENVRSIRPGNGISPKYISEILGKKSKISIKKGTPIKFEFYK
nr:pseudaminic acid synthase [uncultured Treponema sp.]